MLASRRGAVVAHSLFMACTLAAAQGPASPVTAADEARAARMQPALTERDIEAAARRNRAPSDAELARVPLPAAPRLDALPAPAPAAARPLDLGALAKGFDVSAQANPALPARTGPTVLVFVSFSMPDAALARLADQASRTGATLVLRGLVDGSLQKTVLRAQSVIGKRKAGLQIDPQAFDRFSVTSVPTFVLLRDGATAEPCAAGRCYAPSSYVSTTGDVSLDYALETIQRQAPRFGREAAQFLNRLQGK